MAVRAFITGLAGTTVTPAERTLLRELAYQADDLPALAASLRAPLLVLVGAQDQPFVIASRAMADAIPGAKLVVIPDAGHSPQF